MNNQLIYIFQRLVNIPVKYLSQAIVLKVGKKGAIMHALIAMLELVKAGVKVHAYAPGRWVRE
ncbi:hypothetical protein DRN86_04410, partial [Candidatus Geothermarchaeota archaeon]